MTSPKNEWPQLLILLLPVCVAALLWDKLPQRMPIHWNAHGEIDGYAAKPFATFFLPAVNLCIVALIYFLSLIDPKLRHAESDAVKAYQKTFRIVRLVISGFIAMIALAMVGVAAGLPLDMTRVIGAGTAILIAILGNFMGKIRPNYFVGIRTPWTIESPHVWIKTHRFAGRLMIAGALLLLIASFIVKGTLYVSIVVSLVLAIAILPMIHSFVIYRREHPG